MSLYCHGCSTRNLCAAECIHTAFRQCDGCATMIHRDEWPAAADTRRGVTEYTCADCRAEGERERREFERTHARGRL